MIWSEKDVGCSIDNCFTKSLTAITTVTPDTTDNNIPSLNTVIAVTTVTIDPTLSRVTTFTSVTIATIT